MTWAYIYSHGYVQRNSTAASSVAVRIYPSKVFGGRFSSMLRLTSSSICLAVLLDMRASWFEPIRWMVCKRRKVDPTYSFRLYIQLELCFYMNCTLVWRSHTAYPCVFTMIWYGFAWVWVGTDQREVVVVVSASTSQGLVRSHHLSFRLHTYSTKKNVVSSG